MVGKPRSTPLKTAKEQNLPYLPQHVPLILAPICTFPLPRINRPHSIPCPTYQGTLYPTPSYKHLTSSGEVPKRGTQFRPRGTGYTIPTAL
jgi:hypothetical protein